MALYIALAVVLLVLVLVGRAPRGHATRPVTNLQPGHPNWERCYIESTGCGAAHSCSFVEFDERGDYLDFDQHRNAYEQILKLAGGPEPLTVVIYVHGWRHSGQSQDVVSFNHFLHQLAGSSVTSGRRRVHGVYLAWRGATLRHTIEENDAFRATSRCYGAAIIDADKKAPVPLLTELIETASYFNRKSVPEYKFAGTSISRTIFSCAFAAKRNQPSCEVLLMGHSFGGLMLERTLQNATIGELTEAWPWEQLESGRISTVNPLPFDSIVIVNSAAPSIYAKQFQSYLAGHRQAMARAHVPHANTPIMFNVTSAADWATGITHPIANMLCPLVPTLWRKYTYDDFTVERVRANEDIVVPQSYYYRHTPGHNPLLVNRFIESKASATPDGFRTSVPFGDGSSWFINFPPVTPDFDQFSRYRGRRPLAWTRGTDRYNESAYWIVRCPKAIISGHNDIWSPHAMDMYAAFHRIALEASSSQRV